MKRMCKGGDKTRDSWRGMGSSCEEGGSPAPYQILIIFITLWRAAHLGGQLPVLFTKETSSNIVDTFVHCDPNMYS